MSKLDPITLGILWDRLISITDQIVTTLEKCSFSLLVREGGDLSCLLFDAQGRSLAQGTFSSGAFIGTGPLTIRHMLEKFPPQTLKPGDVIMTNDPWIGTGHLFDICVMRPVFRGPRLVGYTMSITHLPDIGGLGWSMTSSEIYEEGLRLPICKIVKAGHLNEELMELIRTNVRTPDMTAGDLMANVTGTGVGGRLLVEFMDEYGIDDLEPLSRQIIDQSEKAMREKIMEIPDGVYAHELLADPAAENVRIACRVSVSGDSVHIDYEGTGPSMRAGVNVPLCYTRAYSIYGVKCLTTPNIPNNEGSFRPITVSAPAGCILNAQPPFPTAARHLYGHFTTIAVFGALAELGGVPAEPGMGGGGPCHGTLRNGKPFASHIGDHSGGLGAHADMDGTWAMPAPYNARGIPIEVLEDFTDLTVEKDELSCDSGGAGEFRGGLGTVQVIRNDSGHPMTVDFLGSRSRFAACGRNGGKPGGLRKLLINGTETPYGMRIVINPGDQVTMVEAGGGGYGNPRRRPVEKVLKDVKQGLVSTDGALRDYGVAVDPTNLTARRV